MAKFRAITAILVVFALCLVSEGSVFRGKEINFRKNASETVGTAAKRIISKNGLEESDMAEVFDMVAKQVEEKRVNSEDTLAHIGMMVNGAERKFFYMKGTLIAEGADQFCWENDLYKTMASEKECVEQVSGMAWAKLAEMETDVERSVLGAMGEAVPPALVEYAGIEMDMSKGDDETLAGAASRLAASHGLEGAEHIKELTELIASHVEKERTELDVNLAVLGVGVNGVVRKVFLQRNKSLKSSAQLFCFENEMGDDMECVSKVTQLIRNDVEGLKEGSRNHIMDAVPEDEEDEVEATPENKAAGGEEAAPSPSRDLPFTALEAAEALREYNAVLADAGVTEGPLLELSLSLTQDGETAAVPWYMYAHELPVDASTRFCKSQLEAYPYLKIEMGACVKTMTATALAAMIEGQTRGPVHHLLRLSAEEGQLLFVVGLGETLQRGVERTLAQNMPAGEEASEEETLRVLDSVRAHLRDVAMEKGMPEYHVEVTYGDVQGNVDLYRGEMLVEAVGRFCSAPELEGVGRGLDACVEAVQEFVSRLIDEVKVQRAYMSMAVNVGGKARVLDVLKDEPAAVAVERFIIEVGSNLSQGPALVEVVEGHLRNMHVVERVELEAKPFVQAQTEEGGVEENRWFELKSGDSMKTASERYCGVQPDMNLNAREQAEAVMCVETAWDEAAQLIDQRREALPGAVAFVSFEEGRRARVFHVEASESVEAAGQRYSRENDLDAAQLEEVMEVVNDMRNKAEDAAPAPEAGAVASDFEVEIPFRLVGEEGVRSFVVSSGVQQQQALSVAAALEAHCRAHGLDASMARLDVAQPVKVIPAASA